MENLDLSISKKGIELLKSLIGQQFISFRHEKTNTDNVFQLVEITVSNGRYLINNDVDWFDNYFSGVGDVPFLDFKELNTDEDPFKTWSNLATMTQLVNEKINDVLIIQDDGDIYENETFFQHMTSSEGIIFITEKTQYGFFKDNMYLDEEIAIIKSKKDALSKAEKLKDHYNIFGYPFSGKCKRSVLSLKDGTTTVVDAVEEVAWDAKKHAQ